jgi:hypothetical protein
MKSLVGSRFVVAMYNLGRLVVQIPFNFYNYIYKITCDKVDLAYSNMPGPTKTYSFGPMNVHTIYMFPPTTCGFTNGFIAGTLENTLTLGFYTDTRFVEEPRILMDILD